MVPLIAPVYGFKVSIIVFCHELVARKKKETVQILENEFSRMKNV